MNSDYVSKGVRITPDGQLVTPDEIDFVDFNSLNYRAQQAALRQGYNPREGEKPKEARQQ